MKSKLAIAALVLISAPAFAQVSVNGYYRQNGTYVQPHQRSAPDGNVYNNYSTQGNVNPYTGQAGTVNPYNVQPAYTPPPAYQAPAYPAYQQPSNIYGTTR